MLKYAAGASVNVSGGQLNWQAGPYRPVVMTAKDDNSAGDTISGSSGSPSGYYANPALSLDSVGGGPFPNLRILYAQQAFVLIADHGGLTLSDFQAVNCQNGASLNTADMEIGNGLFANVSNAFDNNYSGGVVIENGTFANVAYLALSDSGGFNLNLTNCILANVANLWSNQDYTLAGDHNGFYDSPTFGTAEFSSSVWPFQTAGAGSHYLADDSPFWNVGTTNIDPSVLADLQKKTTYPPIIYSNTTIPIAMTFSPQAERNIGTPDLGFHYDPLDWAFGGVDAYSNLTFTAGTVMGWFQLPGSDGPGYGIKLHGQITVAFNGTATVPCVSARYDTVQEGGDGIWTDKGWLAGIASYENNSYDVSIAPQIVTSFTRFSALTSDPNHFRDYYTPLVVYARHCEFWSAGVGGYNNIYCFTNCLFDRTSEWEAYGYSGNEFIAQNCTWHGGIVNFPPYNYPIPIIVRDCAFDGTTVEANYYGTNAATVQYDYNAFTNGATRFPIGGSHDVTNLTSFNWQSSWFGNYYLPPGSPLIDAGDVTADTVGLYHFTTQTNQTIEGNSTVDIGYHYVAVDSNGNPLDYDSDGVPDYIEDANGNGTVDSGETDWQNANDLGLKVLITRPRNGSTLP